MEIIKTALPEIMIVVPRRIGDLRGFFSEVWNARDYLSVGINAGFVQDNHVHTTIKGTLRGLHYQITPAAQGKLVRVSRGAIFDVVVDIRRGSWPIRVGIAFTRLAYTLTFCQRTSLPGAVRRKAETRPATLKPV